jgi:hypothetical protein
MRSTVKLDGVADKRGQWEKRIAEWQRSGQSQKAFCVQRGLALSTFQWWRRQAKRYAPAQTTPAFLPIAMGVSAVEIELRSRTRMRFEGEAALRAVEHLVARVK